MLTNILVQVVNKRLKPQFFLFEHAGYELNRTSIQGHSRKNSGLFCCTRIIAGGPWLTATVIIVTAFLLITVTLVAKFLAVIFIINLTFNNNSLAKNG